MRSLPPLALLLGLAGIIPFALLGAAAVATDADMALRASHALVGYGAVILSFLGGVHWGFTLGEPEARLVRARLVLGVLPALIGWAAVLVDLFFEPLLGLAALIAGFAATLLMETRAQKRDLMPAGYMTMRWLISVVVVALLTTVAVLRAAGGHVLL